MFTRILNDLFRNALHILHVIVLQVRHFTNKITNSQQSYHHVIAKG
jgi:hypothetical protein